MSGGTVVWITGLPGAGKSTLAARVAARLRGVALPCVVLDGDEVRAALDRPAGRGAEERDAFYESLARLAALVARQGLVAIVAATANRAAHRARARALAPRWMEVHVATPAAECERRDPRGLYAAARAGAATGVPGVDAGYEVPAAPDVVASGGEDGAAADRIMMLLGSPEAAAAPRRTPVGPDSRSRPFVPSPGGSPAVHHAAMAIVCGTDLSDRSRPALAAATAIARRTGEPLCAVHVLGGAELVDAAGRERLVAAATERLDREVEAVVGTLDAGVHRKVLVGHAVRDLLSFARSERATLVVVSSQGHAASPLYRLGGTSERIALESPLPVLVVRSAAPFEAWARGERPLRVLVGVDFTASSLSAVQWVKALRRAGPCEVVVGHVYDGVDAFRRYGKGGAHSLVDPDPEVERLLERDVAAIAGDLAEGGAASVRVHLALGRLADHVVELAEAERADVIVVGTHHRRGPARLWSVSTGVLHLGRVSVVTVPTQPGASLGPEGLPTVRRVLVATDLSDASYWATSFAYALVGREGGDVHLLHVLRPPGSEEGAPDLASRLRALVPRVAEREGITTHVEIARGAVVREICSAAERLGVDVVCLASHGESGMKTFLGSVVAGVLKESTKPVLVLHPPPA